MHFENCRVPKVNLVRGPGHFADLMLAFNMEHIHNATFSLALSEAARSLGDTRWRAFRRVTLPLLLLAVSLGTTSYVLSAGKGVVKSLPGGVAFLLDTVEFVLLAGALTALYRYVPNTPVRRSHAIIGGLMGAVFAHAGLAALHWEGLKKIILSLVLSPIVGTLIGYTFDRDDDEPPRWPTIGVRLSSPASRIPWPWSSGRRPCRSIRSFVWAAGRGVKSAARAPACGR